MQGNGSELGQDISSYVYLICGRNINNADREKINHFLKTLGLLQIIKETAVHLTGEPSPFVDEIINDAFHRAKAIIVLFTGDDNAHLCSRLLKDSPQDPEGEIKPQPRQDQIFEAGYAFGRSPKQTILLRIGNHMRPFSDIDGRYIANFTWKAPDLIDLVSRLKSAGCSFKFEEAILNGAGFPEEFYEELAPLLVNSGRNNSAASNRGVEIDEQESSYTNPRKVFVIHGRNKKINKHLFAFLNVIGLSPISWRDAVGYTNNSAPYIGEVLEAFLRQAQAVVVLLTGDDEAGLQKQLAIEGDTEDDFRILPQPRLNVLFEAGMAFSNERLAKKPILVQVCAVRICSYLAGRDRINLTNAMKDRMALVRSLASAGCKVEMPEYKKLRETGNFRCV